MSFKLALLALLTAHSSTSIAESKNFVEAGAGVSFLNEGATCLAEGCSSPNVGLGYALEFGVGRKWGKKYYLGGRADLGYASAQDPRSYWYAIMPSALAGISTGTLALETGLGVSIGRIFDASHHGDGTPDTANERAQSHFFPTLVGHIGATVTISEQLDLIGKVKNHITDTRFGLGGYIGLRTRF